MEYFQRLWDIVDAAHNQIEFEIKTSPEFYFILGQLVMYIFSKRGGVDCFRSEINYLTNPYMEQSIGKLGQRSLRFVGFLPRLLPTAPSFIKVIQRKLRTEHGLLHDYTCGETCQVAFYAGIYADNIMILFEDGIKNGYA